MTPERLRPAFTTIARLTVIAAALLMLTVLVVNRSQAAFSDTTGNPGNTFASGDIVLDDDDGGVTALFETTDMAPGNPVVKCLELTYSGSIVPSAIRTYGTSSGALAPYLDLQIEIGTGGDFSDCTGFTPSATLFNNTLANFSATHANWSGGLATITAAANPTVRTLRFTVNVQDTDAAQALAAAAAFTFEAQSSP